MSTLGSSRAPFAELASASLSGRTGLVHRLVATLNLELPERRADPDDVDRVLLETALVAVEADLLLRVRKDTVLVGALRHLAPALPLTQQGSRSKVELRLFLDLTREHGQALAAAGGEQDLVFVLQLRGQVEHRSNPLYDADGYQVMRVGDSGTARALQAMGHVERAALLPLEAEIPVPTTGFTRLLWELGVGRPG